MTRKSRDFSRMMEFSLSFPPPNMATNKRKADALDASENDSKETKKKAKGEDVHVKFEPVELW